MGEKLIASGKIAAAAAGINNPLLGLAGTALFEALSFRSAQKVEQLLRGLEADLSAQEAGGRLKIDDLIANRDFIDAVLVGCAIARYTSREEKIQRIRRALNFCALRAPAPEQVDSFLHLLDQLSEDCFAVLQVIASNAGELKKAKNLQDVHATLVARGLSLSFDAFAHYWYELKSRRLILVSEQIADEDGILSTGFLALEKGKDGEAVIVTPVARQLLDVTTEN